MARGHKFNAKRTDCTACGKAHPSKHEAKRCADLHLLQRAGEIRDLRMQVAFPLFGMGGLPLLSQGRAGGTHRQQLRMTWDFLYTDATGQVVDDAKGMVTGEFQLRRSVFESCYPDIRTVLS